MSKMSTRIIAKQSSKRFIFPLQKNCYFAIVFNIFGKSIKKNLYSICESKNDVNNEKNVCA